MSKSNELFMHLFEEEYNERRNLSEELTNLFEYFGEEYSKKSKQIKANETTDI
jgi:hypothetical protein